MDSYMYVSSMLIKYFIWFWKQINKQINKNELRFLRDYKIFKLFMLIYFIIVYLFMLRVI